MRIHHVTTLSIIALLGLGSQQTTIGQEVKVTQSTEKRSVVGAIATPSSEELNNQIKAVIVDQDGNQRVVELRGLGNGLWQGSMQDPDGHSSEAPADFLFREVDAENAVGSKSKSKVVATSTDSKPVVFGSVFYSDGKDKYQIGVSCEEIPEVLRAHLKLDPGMGLLVGRTFEGMPAHDQLKQHDIILKVNGRSAGSTKDLVEAAQQAGEKSETVVLRVLRSGDERDIVLNPAKQELAINPALKPMS